MPEHLRALIVIAILTTVVFAFTKRPACAMFDQHTFTRRRNLWFAVTFMAFLSPNFWLFAGLASMLLMFARTQEDNLPALYFTILFALPVAYVVVPGFGLVNYIIDLSFQRILVFVLLFPAFLQLLHRSGAPGIGRLSADKWLLGYCLLSVLLYLRDTTLTDTLRQGVYTFFDIFVPYYVVSRLLDSTDKLREAILWLVIAIMLLSIIGMFESARHWLLYNPLIHSLSLGQGMSGYLPRDDILRAEATAGQPIALGYIAMIGIGLYLFIQRSIAKKSLRRLGLLLLLGGLAAPLSRGPWVGALAMFVVYLATGPSAMRRISILALAGVLALPALAVMPGGERVINLLPFIGKTEANTIEYRDQLFTNASIVIKRNLWLGSVDYLDTPEMESMRNGNGLIDIVNSYIGIALEKGLIGLTLFVGFFASVMWKLYRTIRSLPDKNSDEHVLGRALLATLIGILLTIVTVSSITFIPIMYWSIAAIGAAYVQTMQNLKEGIRT